MAVVGPGRSEHSAGGPPEAHAAVLAAAEQIGAELARCGAFLVCGGLGGVMEAASRGASDGGGVAVGLLPGDDPTGANPFVTVAVPTGLGQGRNALVVGAADAVVAVGGSWGTLSEIALARRAGKRVVCLCGWRVADADGQPVPVEEADTPQQAVEMLER